MKTRLPNPRGPGSRKPVTIEWLKSNVREADSGCWEWLGTISGGYGMISSGGKMRSTHRLAYKLLIGEPPHGMDLDHLCRNQICCNPAHLEPVTHAENVRRGANQKFVRGRCYRCGSPDLAKSGPTVRCRPCTANRALQARRNETAEQRERRRARTDRYFAKLRLQRAT